MSPIIRIITPLATALAIITGCSGSDEEEARSCVGSETAEVCLVGVAVDVEIEASGLQPGSVLTVTTTRNDEPAEFEVGDDGALVGTSGLLGDWSGVVVTFAAVDESGQPLGGSLTVEG